MDNRLAKFEAAQKQAKALEAVLENSEWVTAKEIGERDKFSPSNLVPPPTRWKQHGKIFAVPYQGQDRFPRYALGLANCCATSRRRCSAQQSAIAIPVMAKRYRTTPRQPSTARHEAPRTSVGCFVVGSEDSG